MSKWKLFNNWASHSHTHTPTQPHSLAASKWGWNFATFESAEMMENVDDWIWIKYVCRNDFSCTRIQWVVLAVDFDSDGSSARATTLLWNMHTKPHTNTEYWMHIDTIGPTEWKELFGAGLMRGEQKASSGLSKVIKMYENVHNRRLRTRTWMIQRREPPFPPNLFEWNYIPPVACIVKRTNQFGFEQWSLVFRGRFN